MRMKRKHRIYITFIVILALIYVILLFVMLEAESANPESSIRTLGDAVWYSVVTLTTVGYGDITPVTPIGHAVGIIFLLLSTGILVTLVGTLLSFLTSEGFPLMLLSLQKKKNWYYFADTGLESNTLAQQILAEDPRGIIIYGQGESSLQEKPDYPCMFINVSPERIAELKHGIGNKCKVFLMTENDIGVNPRAVNIARLPVEVYAKTASGEDTLSGNIHFFHSYDCCAREYWRQKPVSSGEHQIALIGFDNYGEALLKWAIMTNVISPEHHVTYHIFGDAGDFLHIHPGLRKVFSVWEESSEESSKEGMRMSQEENVNVNSGQINEGVPERDFLVFHGEPWSVRHDFFEEMDRIIICDDDEQNGWDIFWQMRRYYKIRGRIDLRSNRPIPGISYFGTNESIYTTEHILRTNLNQVAITMNNLYRSTHPKGSLEWNQLGDYLRQSKIAASEHLFWKIRILLENENITELTAEALVKAYEVYMEKRKEPACLERYRHIEHQRWLRFYAYYNWTYGETHNEELRKDPRLRPYEELTPEQRASRDSAWELLGELKLWSENE